MKTIWTTVLIACMLLTIGISAARGDDIPVVNANGSASAKVRPDLLRIKLVVTADGKDTKSALSALAQQVDDTKKALAALQPAGDVKADDPGVGTGPTNPQQEQMLEMQRMEQARRHHGKTPPPKVSVYAVITAEWPLGAAGGDDAIVATTELEDKIKAAIPKPGASAKSPEDQEEAEEGDRNDMESDPTLLKPGEPKFIFVHKLTDSERTKTTADAVAQAKSNAEQLSAAAGKPLGAIRQISFSGGMDYANRYEEYMRETTGQENSATRDEVIGDQPGPITYSVSVDVAYALGG